MWKKIVRITLWSLLAGATCTLLVAAIQKKDSAACTATEIEINGAHDHVFVNKNDVEQILKNFGAIKGATTSKIDLRNIEKQLSKNAWIRKADLFFDNNQVLHTVIEEREPLARIFTVQGTSFYIDTACTRLPLSEELSARVPMFTSFPSDNKRLSVPDSLLLIDVKNIALKIQADSFLSAQIAQIDITPQGNYELSPVIGNQLIRIGDAQDLDTKFAKLKAFYQQVWSKTGFEKYAIIDVQYQNQVVATKKGAPVANADTALAKMQMAAMEQRMAQLQKDTLYAAPVIKAVAVKTDTTKHLANNKKPNAKPVTIKKQVKPTVVKKQPKALLKKQ